MSTSPKTPPLLAASALQAAAQSLGSGGAGASRLLALLYEPDVAVDRVLDALQAEPALAARVLKVANSPYYRLSGSVGTLDRAVGLLGLNAIRGIAAAGCLDRLTPGRVGRAFDPQRFRQHSLAVARAAQALARRAGLGCEGEAFMAGLLHDIGVLLLLKAAPVAMAAFEPLAGTDAATALAHERATLGATHEDCAVVLGDAWHWPDWLRQCAAAHHESALPAEGAATEGVAALPALLALADRLAEQSGLGFWPICPAPGSAGSAMPFGLTSEDLDAVAAELPAAVEALSGPPGG